MARLGNRLTLTALALALISSAAEAHTGHGGTAGFNHGFGHPFSGVDHILVMIAVGLFAARLGGKTLWLVPSTFVVMMAAGGAIGLSGHGMPFVEFGIATSVIVLGAMVALEIKAPMALAMGLVGFFAIFHGHAHGAEMPADVSGLTYALGFMAATALLHLAGIGLGLGLGQLANAKSARIAQFAGGAMTVAGVGILAGYI